MLTAKTFVHLTGGLGNQLFQITAARSRGMNGLVVQSNLGAPRLNSNGLPDASDFQYPFPIEFSEKRFHKFHAKFLSKTAGYLLRQGMSPTTAERIPLYSRLVLAVGSIVFSIGFRSRLTVTQATDNGYCDLPKKRISEYLIGYFQSYCWADLLTKEDSLKNIKLKNFSEELTRFIQQVHGQDNLLVHVRLGDYKNEAGFGIPSPEYYSKSISTLCEAVQFEQLVLFSNEPLEAIEYIPQKYRDIVIVAPDFSGSASETLEAMRHMDAYVIGNSSLSWWGAYLSYNPSAPVICPTPWFRFSPEPRKLIPQGWKRVEAWPVES